MRETRTCLVLNQLHEYPFLDELPDPWLDLLADLGQPVEYPAKHRIFSEGDRAEHFWLIGDGAVTLDVHDPERGDIAIETIAAGSALGWSWMFPPYRWHFGAVTTRATRALRFRGRDVLLMCRANPVAGMDLMQRFVGVTLERLQATRFRLLNR
ncbi:hypothetical protein Rhe02_00130 [Rhizocola hellebori]|uniref:Cyclic nucleotide-binding domain-containing protein n=1 Tax=Rhizocola hellebori TaxID=1392758 RepID=A0A8J3VCU6_9ACTN|nr:cyclic nucleotide-binding domain-containing protein [Rhizocola hellebori]GIH01946.1 hypothetical protein Rhe02_00130 [Rhizocola hellebori]